MADNADNTLTAEPRTVAGSRPAGRLRREGKVPAVMYGLETETANVTVPSRELNHILAGESGANTLITLKLDGEEVAMKDGMRTKATATPLARPATPPAPIATAIAAPAPQPW